MRVSQWTLAATLERWKDLAEKNGIICPHFGTQQNKKSWWRGVFVTVRICTINWRWGTQKRSKKLKNWKRNLVWSCGMRRESFGIGSILSHRIYSSFIFCISCDFFPQPFIYDFFARFTHFYWPRRRLNMFFFSSSSCFVCFVCIFCFLDLCRRNRSLF